ncbi:MAG: electron transfer flavoprotein subunit beta/FixA family protein [Dissulfuribacterales bacterium]|uniref:electron transfer flavoprotein subunit beta/FixA family protein n=1 Tax=Desulfosarcina sp. BuS5 TaxID=933262 RepID=UPI0004890230|nr:electron transfer flavoprotein subunit beta/FixA family protein [Desulfosarcina sp. BuS5]WDN87790.1 electron transfer flavoprotein beta subunit [Desulfosarcina sp. BuS5]
MEILVCVKRVPDTAENEIEVNSDGTDIDRDDLVYSVNEWDNYAVEEAIQIRDNVGGNVTVVSVGDEESEEVIRREMAMGADQGVLLSDDAFNDSDGKGIASILKAEIEKGKFDLIMTGAQADDGAGQVGGMLAAMLDLPYASLVNTIEITDDKKIKVGREVEGGNIEMNEIELPCVLSIQTGINEPRYVGIRGIRKVASVEIPVHGTSDLGLASDAVGEAGANVKKVDYFIPDTGEGAEILEGSTEEIIDKLVEYLKAKGGIK